MNRFANSGCRVAQTPTRERLLQKHFQAGPVHHYPKLHWAAFFQAGYKNEELVSSKLSAVSSPTPPASIRQRQARRTRGLEEKKIKAEMQPANASHTARVRVARIARGSATSNNSAGNPFNRRRRNESRAISPSRVQGDPIRHRLQKRAAGAIGVDAETFVQNVAWKDPFFGADQEQDRDQTQIAQYQLARRSRTGAATAASSKTDPAR